MFSSFLSKLPSIQGVHLERVEFHQPFEVIAEQFAGDKGTAVLLSGTDLDCARYHILAARPWLTIVGKGENLTINSRGEELKFNGDPLECVARVTEHFKIMEPEVMESDALKPVSAGLFGYFAYDLKDSIERLPRTCIDQGLPDLFLFSPSIIFFFDKIKEDFHLSIPVIPSIYSGETAANRVERVRTLFFKKVSVFNSSAKKNFFHDGLIKDSSGLGVSAEDCIKKKNGPGASEKNFMIESSGLKSNFSKPEYINAVEKIIEYIKAGDIYQVNLSQRFTAQFKGDPYSLFIECFKKNPAPFFAFINADDHQIISTSPERFIKRDGEKIETRPIKGTLPRGKNPIEDKKLAEKLLKSFKDDAELSMIVDLMRNDFGKVAKSGTVRVKEHKMLEPYDNVFHLVSVVTALLDKDKTSIDLIKAAFPGGSITGCPKIRAMEIIDELESVKRHIYTGSIGYLSFHNTMDLSIAIRTATIFNKELGFSVGGGIVYDSDPEKEYQETLDKGETFIKILAPEKRLKRVLKKRAWINGKIINEDHSVISALSPGFQYGAGLFETIRVDNGKPLYLKEHVQRLNNSLRTLFSMEPFDLTWEHVIDQLVTENRLNNETAAVKIIAAKGNNEKGVGSWSVSAFVRPYLHRLAAIGKKGVDLVTYPGPRQSYLADHKTLNYLYYYLASLYAKEKHGDEALILNSDSTVSETNTCSIMAVSSKTVILPESSHVLPGVTLDAALKVLSKSGYRIVRKKIKPGDFFSSGNVILTNALMGAVPVLSLDGKKMQYSENICEKINSSIFNS